MGQKTHPIGFRLQVKKNWSSTWFPGDSFAFGLEEDSRIRKYIKARLPNAGIAKVEISRTTKTVTITIHTCLLYTSPSPRDLSTSRMPSSA